MSNPYDLTDRFEALQNAESVTREMWEQSPEPNKLERPGTVVTDMNIDGQAWMYNVNKESEQWLVFHGETTEIER